MSDMGALVARYKATQNYGNQQAKEASNFDRHGKLNAEGQRKLKRAVLMMSALLDTAHRRGWANE